MSESTVQATAVEEATVVTLQDAYDSGVAPSRIQLDGTRDGIQIRDASVPIAAELFGVQTFAGARLFGVDAGNVDLGVDTRPIDDQTIRLGAGTRRFLGVHGRLLAGLGSSNANGTVAASLGTRTYGLNPTGVIGGNMVEYGSGAALFRHGAPTAFPNNGFKPVATIANVFAGYGGGDASVLNNGGGSFLGGSAYTYGSGNALLQSNDFGNFTWAYSYATGAGNHTWNNDGAGAILFGYSQGLGSVDVIISGVGSFTAVRPVASSGQSCNVINSGAGAFINGYISAFGANSNMSATSTGAFVQGSANNGGTLRATAPAAFAQGIALGAGVFIEATQFGAMARGEATNSYSIRATSQGAVAIGSANTAAIEATARNAIQFGPGTNAQALSLQVGQVGALGPGIRLHGLGVPGVPVNGDIWVDAAGFVNIQSGGVTCVATNAVM